MRDASLHTDELQIECVYQYFQSGIPLYHLLKDSFVRLHFEQIIGNVVSLSSFVFAGVGLYIIEHLHVNSATFHQSDFALPIDGCAQVGKQDNASSGKNRQAVGIETTVLPTRSNP